MTATLLFRIPQSLLNIYEVQAIADILGEKPRLKPQHWIFSYEIDPELLDWIEDATAINSAAWKFWTQNIRRDFRQTFGPDLTDEIEECLYIRVNEPEPEPRTIRQMLGVAR
jgi:hypothetical protein